MADQSGSAKKIFSIVIRVLFEVSGHLMVAMVRFSCSNFLSWHRVDLNSANDNKTFGGSRSSWELQEAEKLHPG